MCTLLQNVLIGCCGAGTKVLAVTRVIQVVGSSWVPWFANQWMHTFSRYFGHEGDAVNVQRHLISAREPSRFTVDRLYSTTAF